jgi:glycosyltransferase involved in cell wall biosynthesis
VGLRGFLSRKLSYFFERNSARTCGLTVANSLHTAELIGRIYQVAPGRIFLLYKAVDLGSFRFRNRPAGGPVRRVLFVKNDWRRGGLDLILKALGNLPEGRELTLALAGIAKPEENLVKEIAARCRFTGTVEFLGILGREALLVEMDRADLFLNFSRQEALGVSCLEAMATGLPVVASDAGGLKEVLDGGRAGVQVPAGDTQALENSLRRILQHPEELESARLYAREHAARFSLENLEANLQILFRRLEENQPTGS